MNQCACALVVGGGIKYGVLQSHSEFQRLSSRTFREGDEQLGVLLTLESEEPSDDRGKASSQGKEVSRTFSPKAW